MPVIWVRMIGRGLVFSFLTPKLPHGLACTDQLRATRLDDPLCWRHIDEEYNGHNRASHVIKANRSIDFRVSANRKRPD